MEEKFNKTVEIKDIILEEEFYPRSTVYWQTSYIYAENMKSGAEFPPITLALINENLFLVDGKHRIEAHKLLKKKEIKAEVHTGWTRKKVFEEAIKRNMVHGRVLSPFERRRLVLKLRDWDYNNKQISELIQVPITKLNHFVGQRLVNSITGEVIVKSAIKHKSNSSKEYQSQELIDMEVAQDSLSSKSQVSLLKQLLVLLENDLLDKANPKIKNLLTEIKELI